MTLGIDASNIRFGGGLNHLPQLLRADRPDGVDRAVVWAGRTVADQIAPQPWLDVRHVAAYDRSPLHVARHQRSRAHRAETAAAGVLFVPSGNYVGPHRRVVTMSRNLLPFDPVERARYPGFKRAVRYRLLEAVQTATMRRAAGVIFLSERAQAIVEARTGQLPCATAVVPHGIDPSHRIAPRPAPEAYTETRPFEWLYVSYVKPYKHPWNVVAAVAALRADGLPVRLRLVGSAYGPSEARLRAAMAAHDPAGAFVTYDGPAPREMLVQRYTAADGFVFASTCETFGQILLESMAAGLPVVSSDYAAMPDVLGDAGLYADPLDVPSLTAAMRRVVTDPVLRARLAQAAFDRAATFSWERCRRETFRFLTSVA